MASKREPADKAEISSDTSASSAWTKSMVQSHNKQLPDNVSHLTPLPLARFYGKVNLTFFFLFLLFVLYSRRHKRLHPEAVHLSNVTFGDGSPFPEDKLHRIIEIQQELCYDVQWRHGDVLLIDNFAVQHGRRPYDGTRRNVFISSWGAEEGSNF